MRTQDRLVVLRIVVLGLLTSWLWKYGYWWFALQVHARQQLDDPFFPSVLQRFEVFAAALLTPVAIGVWSLRFAKATGLAFACVTFALAAMVLLLHQASYNDATFVTTFWVALWGLWLCAATRPSVGRSTEHDTHLLSRAAMLAQLLIGLWFFGGVVGKSTPGYLNGEVLYDIYFRDRAYLPFELARSVWQGDALHTASRWYSRAILLVECGLMTLPFWPLRPAMHFALFTMISICVFSNWQLFSVFAAPLSVCIVVLRVARNVDLSTAGRQSAGPSFTPSSACRAAPHEQIIAQQSANCRAATHTTHRADTVREERGRS